MASLHREEPEVLGRTILLMPAARTQAHAPSLPRRRSRGAARRSRSLPQGIRWDRVQRWALLAVCVVVVLLAIGPALGLLETVRESGARKQQLQELEQRNRQLKERKDALNDPSNLEREARRLGKVMPGERPYVIQGLPKN